MFYLACICSLFIISGACFPPPWPNIFGSSRGAASSDSVGICNLSNDPSVKLMGVKMCEQHCRQTYPGRRAVCGVESFAPKCYCLQENFPGELSSFAEFNSRDKEIKMCNNDLVDSSKRETGRQMCTSICGIIHDDYAGNCILNDICECYSLKNRKSFRLNEDRCFLSIPRSGTSLYYR